MSSKVNVEIGTSAEEMGRRFVAAWHAAEAGETIEPKRVLVFENFEALLSILSTPRLSLLKHLARRPEPSIRALAGSVGRDYKRVHADVTALVGAGLIRQEGRRLMLGARSARAEIDFVDAAV